VFHFIDKPTPLVYDQYKLNNNWAEQGLSPWSSSAHHRQELPSWVLHQWQIQMSWKWAFGYRYGSAAKVLCMSSGLQIKK
jgi:hypothetical protein